MLPAAVPEAGERRAPGATACPSSAAEPADAARQEPRVAARPAGRGRADDRADAQDVDHLTQEDEETWFEGAEDATPPVWE